MVVGSTPTGPPSARSTTTDDPVEVAYGPGYTGVSDGWVDERIDLSAYAGSEIEIRFEYVTDTTLQKPDFAIDDVAITERSASWIARNATPEGGTGRDSEFSASRSTRSSSCA